jgi:zinc transporter ZupT
MTSDSLLDVVNATLLEHHNDHDHSHEMDEDDDPTMAKVVAMVVLFSSSQLLGLLPYPLAKWFNLTSTKNSNVLSTLLSFGAGVLICTTFLHLLPEVSENIR